MYRCVSYKKQKIRSRKDGNGEKRSCYFLAKGKYFLAFS